MSVEISIPDTPLLRRRSAVRPFKYWSIAPAIFVLLLVGLFPLVYSLVVSVQGVTMMTEDTSFHGLANYARLFSDIRLWKALGHTALFTAIALPVELIFGLAMAHLGAVRRNILGMTVRRCKKRCHDERAFPESTPVRHR